MVSVQFDLVGKRAIEQGASLNWLTFVVAADFRGWTPRGEIRNNYVSLGGEVKGEFDFKPLVYGEVTLEDGVTKITGTVIRPYMDATATSQLDWAQTRMKLRSSPYEKPIPGRNVWVYDIELLSPTGEIVRVVQGFVEVSLQATQ